MFGAALLVEVGGCPTWKDYMDSTKSTNPSGPQAVTETLVNGIHIAEEKASQLTGVTFYRDDKRPPEAIQTAGGFFPWPYSHPFYPNGKPEEKFSSCATWPKTDGANAKQSDGHAAYPSYSSDGDTLGVVSVQKSKEDGGRFFVNRCVTSNSFQYEIKRDGSWFSVVTALESHVADSDSAGKKPFEDGITRQKASYGEQGEFCAPSIAATTITRFRYCGPNDQAKKAIKELPDKIKKAKSAIAAAKKAKKLTEEEKAAKVLKAMELLETYLDYQKKVAVGEAYQKKYGNDWQTFSPAASFVEVSEKIQLASGALSRLAAASKGQDDLGALIMQAFDVDENGSTDAGEIVRSGLLQLHPEQINSSGDVTIQARKYSDLIQLLDADSNGVISGAEIKASFFV